MTASQPTPRPGESISDEQGETDSDHGIRHMGRLDACEHDLYAEGPASLLSTNHTGDVDVEVFTGARVRLGVESEETALASTGIGFTPEQARRLAALLHEAADELDGAE